MLVRFSLIFLCILNIIPGSLTNFSSHICILYGFQKKVNTFHGSASVVDESFKYYSFNLLLISFKLCKNLVFMIKKRNYLRSNYQKTVKCF